MYLKIEAEMFLKDLLKDFSISLGVDLSDDVIEDFLIKWRHPYKVEMDRVVEVVSEVLEVPPKKIFSKTRKGEAVFARQMIMYIASRKNMNFSEISRWFGEMGSRRNRATVDHSVKVINNFIKYNKEKRQIINQLLRLTA